MANLLKIEDLWVKVEGKEVLKGIDLEVSEGSTHVIMGPNACGKTSLALTILGYPEFRVVKGKVWFGSEELLGKAIDQRARLGIGLAYQNSPEVRGVKFRDILRMIKGVGPWNPLVEPGEGVARPLIEKVDLDPELFLARDINLGFSGGERKRSELAQVFAMKPKLMILDEPDSGVDIDSLELIGKEIGEFVDQTGAACIIITHHRHILRYLKPDVAYIMYGGKIVIAADPKELIPKVEQMGYGRYVRELREKVR